METEQDVHAVDGDGADGEISFEEKIRRRVKRDIEAAKRFVKPWHEWCKDMHGFYHNAQKYKSLLKDSQYPATVIQEDVDDFVADSRDKLFYSGRPCRLAGREESDKDDAEVKQEVMDYQDDEDRVFKKTGLALRDCAMYCLCASQVDYKEKTRREWVIRDVPIPALDHETGQEILDESGAPVPLMANGIPITRQDWVLEDIPVYRGSTVKRVDPMNLFFTQDKDEIDDEFPIMVRDFVSLEFFDSQDYFFNQDKIKERHPGGATDNEAAQKREDTMLSPDTADTRRPYEYFEWQAPIDKQELYEYLLEKGDKAEADMAAISPGEKVWAIVGLVDGEVLVQLRDNPFDLDRPNIVIGVIDAAEEGLKGNGLAQKIEAAQRGTQHMLGMLFENLHQSVNAMWVINTNMLTTKGQKVNRAGGILETNGNVDEVARRIEQPRVAPDIWATLEYIRQSGQNQGGRQDIMSGRGDAAAETLGESTQAMSQAVLRMRDYLKSFEDTYVKPLYQLRNHINATLIDTEYAYRLVGEKALAWRTVQPEQLRTPVDFVCESSTRETNRAIIIQQMLQFIQIAPHAQQAGQPVRFDKMMAELAESGFNMSRSKIKDFFPLLKLEEDGGVDVDAMLIQNAMLQLSMPQIMAQQAAAEGGGPGEELPQPRNESEAVTANQARNQPQVGRMGG